MHVDLDQRRRRTHGEDARERALATMPEAFLTTLRPALTT
jgi:hypothetical protein